MRLFIIGNGFDIGLKVPSEYSKFGDYVKRKNPNLYENFQVFFDDGGLFTTKKDFWSRFEEKLGNPIPYQLQKNSRTIVSRSSLADMYEEVRSLLFQWIGTLFLPSSSNQLVSFLKDKVFKPDDLFFSFNYTDWLEDNFDVEKSQICHIHGDYHMGMSLFGHSVKEESLIIGCSNNFSTIEENCPPDVKGELVEYESLVIKDVTACMNANKQFFNKIREKRNLISSIEIIGCSFGDVDMPYFVKILKLLKGKNANIYIYSKNCIEYKYAEEDIFEKLWNQHLENQVFFKQSKNFWNGKL